MRGEENMGNETGAGKLTSTQIMTGVANSTKLLPQGAECAQMLEVHPEDPTQRWDGTTEAASRKTMQWSKSGATKCRRKAQRVAFSGQLAQGQGVGKYAWNRAAVRLGIPTRKMRPVDG